MFNEDSISLCGGGFIGNHLVKRLKRDGYYVRACDLKFPEYDETEADDFLQGDLRNIDFCEKVIDRRFDEVFQLAADMGGAGFIFTGENDADIMHNSATINLNVLETCKKGILNIFFIVHQHVCILNIIKWIRIILCVLKNPYPANPDSEYGWEKLFSERLYLAYGRCYGMKVRVARYHNIFGPLGTWDGGREKSTCSTMQKSCSGS